MKDNFAPSVRYTREDYGRLRETYRRWWAGSLDRPIVPIVTTGHDSWRSESPCRPLCFGNAWDPSATPQQLVDARDWELSRMRWHGDAFPTFSLTPLGPGVMAAFLGCTPVGREDTVWFQPPRADIPIEELHFELDEGNPHLRRALNIYDAAMEKWRGSVVLSMVDLGGIMDVLSSFRGAENLLMDLYDSPDEVLRCVGELQELWFRYFDMFNSLMGGEVMGYSHWYGIYGEEPGYILQSDFSYMIGPDMFAKFVAPELASSAARISNAVYHLDGMGELPHLDQLLATEAIRGVQWVPGAGAPEKMDWTEVLARILASGKKLLSLNQKPDGRPIDIAADPGQLFFGERRFDAGDMRAAREYGGLYGIEVK